MDGLLFDPNDYTDERIRAVMEGKTCRTCGNRIRLKQGNKIFSYCGARPSGRTSIKLLKVKASQPACIRFVKIEKNDH